MPGNRINQDEFNEMVVRAAEAENENQQWRERLRTNAERIMNALPQELQQGEPNIPQENIPPLQIRRITQRERREARNLARRANVEQEIVRDGVEDVEPAHITARNLGFTFIPTGTFKTYYKEMDKDTLVVDVFTNEQIYKRNSIKVFTNLVNNKFGYTKYPNRACVGVHSTLGEIFALNTQVMIDGGMIESLINGLFWSKDNFTNRYNDYEKFSNSCAIYTDEDYYKFGEKSRTYLLTEGKRYTFGVELEFASSTLPSYLQSKYNMKCMRDGSLNAGAGGPEYVTGVLIGDSGLKHLQEICIELAKRSTIDEFCGRNECHLQKEF